MENILIIEDEEETLNKGNNNLFPWMGKITNMCKDAILDPNIKRLDDLIATFLTDVEKDVKQCYCKPKRAEKLKTRMNSLLIFFHEIYLEIKKPLEHTSYLDKISDIMALYIDLELKSSKRKREDPKKISNRICSCLFIFLDKSTDHMLDAVLKSRFFGKTQTYSDICEPIIARLLKECPGYMYDTNYVRYLLSFKLWKKLAGKERFVAINKEAVMKLRPPPDFVEKLKCGTFANVLPYVAKSEKDRLTLFFLRSPFNIKKKAEVFLKDCRKSQPVGEFDQISIDEDFDSNLFEYNDTEPKEHGTSLEIMKEMWTQLMDRELNSIDDIFSCDSLDDTNRMMLELNIISKNGSNIPSTQYKLENCESKILHNNDTLKLKNLLIGAIPKDESCIKSSSCIKAEDTLKNDECKLKPSLNSPTNKIKKPCATVEPVESDTFKEIEANSHSFTAVHRPIMIKSTLSSVENDTGGEVNSKLSCENVREFDSIPVVGSSQIDMSNKNSSEVNSAGIVHSSNEVGDKVGATEEVEQLQTHELSSLISVEGVICNDERMLVYNDDVAEEIEIDNTSDVALDVLMGEDMQNSKLDQRTILNVIGVSNDLITVPAIRLDSEKKTQGPKDNPSLEKQKSSSDDKNTIKKNNVNDTTTTSPENQFLSSFLASSENCDNYVSLGQDTYMYNDLMISHYLSEVNADEVSDDEQRFPGKLGAFKNQTKESKSDSEEFETPSPDSRADSISVIEASPGSNPQLSATQPIIRFEEEISPSTSFQDKEADKAVRQCSPNPDCPQLKKRVSVHVTHLKIGPINNEKMNSKGMFEPADNSLHNKTFTLDEHYELGVNDLFSLTHSSNIFNSTNRPSIAPPSFNCRCQCTVCTEKYIFLVRKYQQLLLSITRLEEDVKLSKIKETHAQQEILLKSIQDTLNSNEKVKNIRDDKNETREIIIGQEVVQNSEKIHDMVTIDRNDHEADLQREDASALKTKSCLPPKKRKSFSLPSSQRPLTKIRKGEFSVTPNVDRSSRKCENNNDGEKVKVISPQSGSKNEEIQNSDKIRTENNDKTFKTKIIAIDGSYCVIPQYNDTPLSTSTHLSSNMNDDYTSSKENKKSCCYRKRKEEKKLRREKKRLKKQKKERLLADETSSKSS